MRSQMFNVRPAEFLQDSRKDERTAQMGMKSETEQGYHSSPLDREATNDPDMNLTSVLLGLRRVTAALGLLPWDATEPEASCRARTRFCFIILVVVMVGTMFIAIESKYNIASGFVIMI